MSRLPIPDDRAVVSPVSNVLIIGITTILILGLIIASTGLLADQQERTARSELRTVGEGLAVELEQVATLARRGGSPNITTQHVESILGERYTVELLTGSQCNTPRISADTCLRLSSNDPDTTQFVSVNNASYVNVYLESESRGQFALSARNDGTNPNSERSAGISDTDLNSRIGVGEDVTRRGITLGTEPGNRPPVARFTYSPASPQNNDNVEFDATGSYDPDGSIEEYLWDFNGDGAYETTTTSPTVSRSLSAGNYDVSLRVVDNADGTSDQTQFIDVSGLAYNGDLQTQGSNDVEFTLTNNFGEEVRITHVSIDPVNDDIDRVDDIDIDADNDGTEYGSTDIYPDGRIVELDDYAELDAGSDATVVLGGFNRNVDGERFNIGVQYVIDGTPNSTQFTDTVGGASIRNYRLTASGQNIDLSFDSTAELDTIRVDYGGASSGTLTEGDFSRTATGGGYEYTADVSDGTSGYFWANMTEAATDTDTSDEVPLNDSVVTSSGTYLWRTGGDWDAATDEQGVVHASYGDHSADRVTLGYPAEDPNGGALVGYWPLDDTGSATDASGTGNDGVVEGSPTTASGLFGTDAYDLDGDDDYVRIPDSSSLDVSDEDTVTVSAWVNIDQEAVNEESGWVAIFQNSDTSYNLQFDDVNEPEFTIYDGDWVSADYGEINANEWYHYVGVYDGDTVELWVNGTRVDTNGDADSVADSGSVDAGIGENIDSPDRHLDGQIDEVRVYDRALSDDEVEGLYDTSTFGTLMTDWRNGPAINTNNDVALRYQADIDSDQSVRVRVHADYGPSGEEESDWVTLSDGAGEVAVDFSRGGPASRYRLEVELESDSPRRTPTVDSLEVVDDS